VKRLVFAAFFALTAAIAQAAGLDEVSSADAASGIREALARGADYAVSSLGQKDGFLGNPKVRIPLPGYLQKAEGALRMFGFGKQVDQFEQTMNHAAENAVAEAKPILVDSIRKMTLQDAKAILTGGDDSVTQFFRRSSSDKLAARFMPIVQGETRKLQLADQYNAIAGKAVSAGLIDAKNADIDTYVTHKAMDGLFLMIAEEEKKLRADPIGTGSAILKRVFGAL
jgi:hypothetical protein